MKSLGRVFDNFRVAYEYVPSFQAWWTITFGSPDGFRRRSYPISEMWYHYGGRVWETIDRVLNFSDVNTRYYDGRTHLRLFSAPIDQVELYGPGSANGFRE